MNASTLYFATFAATAIAFIASRSAYYYLKAARQLVYETHQKFESFILLLATISMSWTFLEVFADGFNANLGWWALCFLLGAIATGILKGATDSACKRIWPSNTSDSITIVKTSKALLTIVYSALIIIDVAFAIFFAVALFCSNDGIGYSISFFMLTILFLFGAYNSFRQIRQS